MRKQIPQYFSYLLKSDLNREYEANYLKKCILEVFCLTELMELVCLQVQTFEVLGYLRHESIFINY